MSKEELEKDYYADRPTEPYSDDDSPNDWANIAHYAEENLEKAFKRIAELEKENALARELLGKWYGQHSEKGYTETFYQNLLRETEKLLWGNASER
jgi:hypothetical protein